ncbi:tRNA pseudouridine synthase-like 1 [Diabrotica virgifera virgifera]|uniref:tRNA pseudouridine synthase n=1 Tax=Diabrotica virgifera virgifera TaxID=50390 RepID=A0A6P7GU34_DIAVI|nr:tRNA pseudouridine synthase-like 1 [Diabrotica virgifera virgifera]
MSSFRYLMHIAYMGKPFRGSQRQIKALSPRPDDPLTVQGRLEMGLKRLNPINDPIVEMSSRTDTGVNALNSICHVDLTRRNDTPYHPNSITLCLNKYFNKDEVPIRILKTYNVPESFHCRQNALSRTYLYRLMIAPTENLHAAPSINYIPIEEWDRCLFYCTNTFDIERMKEGAKLLEGYHDFRSFMGKITQQEYKLTRRVLEYIHINHTGRPGYSPYSWPDFTHTSQNDYIFLDVYIKSKGFLYRQVRRTVAALIALAQGKISLSDIKLMLEVPSRHSWCPQIKTLPAHGLYLCEVEYSKGDLDTFRAELDLDKKVVV